MYTLVMFVVGMIAFAALTRSMPAIVRDAMINRAVVVLEANPNDSNWSDEQNDRRIELIDKDIQGNITIQESGELAELQRRAVAYRDRIAPLPIEGAQRLHRRLLEMKRQKEGN